MKQCSKYRMSRRDFLRSAAVTAAGLFVEGCQPQGSTATPTAEAEAKPKPKRTRKKVTTSGT